MVETMTQLEKRLELAALRKGYADFVIYGDIGPEEKQKLIDEIGIVQVEISKIENMKVNDATKKIKYTTLKIESKWD